MPTDLEQSIIRTLKWFSFFDQPLTDFEIWKKMIWPNHEYSLLQTKQALDHLSSDGIILRKNGYHTLFECDIEGLLKTRHERFLDAERKYKKLKIALKYICRLKSVIGVAAVNTLSNWNTKRTSDIDLLVIVSKGKIWSTRAFLVLPFALLGQRPDHDHDSSKDPICFSFFVDENNLDFEKLKIGNSDPYLSLWIKDVVPIFDRGGVFKKLMEANKWCREEIPMNFFRTEHPYHRVIKHQKINWPNFLESWFKSIQLSKFPTKIKERMNNNTDIVVNDGMLKFHEDDTRQELLNKLKKLDYDS